MIYFIQTGKAGPIKIGYTENKTTLKQRFDTLQSATPFKLFLLGTMDGNHKEEKGLHRKFKILQLAGEWFQVNDILINFIAGMGSGPDIKNRDSSFPINLKKVLQEAEIKYITDAILLSKNKTHAAQLLGLSLTTLAYKFKLYGLNINK